MPTAPELPPGLAMLAQSPPLSLGAANPEGDVSRLTQVLDQTIAARSAQWQATQAGQAQNQPTVTGMAPSWGVPAVYASPSEPRPARSGLAQSGLAQSGLAQPGPWPPGPGDPGPVQTRRMRRRPNTWVIALVLGVAVVAAIVAFIAVPRRPPRVVSVLVVRARVGVCGDGLAPQCLTQAQQLAERLRRGQGPPHGRLLHQQGRLGR